MDKSGLQMRSFYTCVYMNVKFVLVLCKGIKLETNIIITNIYGIAVHIHIHLYDL